MSGWRQRQAVIVRPPDAWRGMFVPTSSGRCMCRVCGAVGRDGWDRPYGWQASHLLGHPEKCDECGARFVRGGLHSHRGCRSGHEQCAEHAHTQYRRLVP